MVAFGQGNKLQMDNAQSKKRRRLIKEPAEMSTLQGWTEKDEPMKEWFGKEEKIKEGSHPGSLRHRKIQERYIQ